MTQKLSDSRRMRCAALALGCLAMAVVFGCGSGDDLIASGGIGGTGVTIGEVSDYGSIFVNGVEFDTRQAGIVVDGTSVGTGNAAAYAHLPVGQWVVVQGDMASRYGTARRVLAVNRVIGAVQQIHPIDDHTLQLTVLGQTVYVTRQTALSGITMDDIMPDMVIRISGPTDAQGAVHAAYIAWVADSSQGVGAVLRGPVQALDTVRKTFQINALTIDYSQADVPPDLIAPQRTVSVEGLPASGLLVADVVRPFETESFDSVDDFFIDGFISMADGQWHLNGYRLQLSTQTQFDGLSGEDLGSGMRVWVRGRLRNRVLVANRLSSADHVRLASSVAAIDRTNGVLTLEGMPALTIRTNSLTRFQSAANDLADIAPGDHLHIFAYPLDNLSVAADIVLVRPAADRLDRFLLQGPVTVPGAPRFTVLGEAIDATLDPETAFYDADGTPFSAADFLAALQEGTIVRISGRIVSGQVHYEVMALVR